MIIWFTIGAILILLELFTPMFIFLFFGIGAWAAALVAIIFPGLQQEIIAFITVTLLSLFFLRQKMIETFQGKKSKLNPNLFPHIGKQAEATKDISPTQEGEISVGGSYWRATATTFIAKDSIVIVRSCAPDDELLLIVESSS